MPRRPSTRNNFPVAIICALKVEYDAVSHLVDWWGDGDGYGKAAGDRNTYKTGRMGDVNVVLVRLSGTGKSISSAATAGLSLSFPRLKLVILAGICGGVPSGTTDQKPLLGDVVISNSIVEYDLGKQYSDGFETSPDFGDRLGGMKESVRSLVVTLEADHWRGILEGQAADFLKQLQKKALYKLYKGKPVKYPGAAKDRLYEHSYPHKHQLSMPPICGECCNSDNYTVGRDRLEGKRKLEEHGFTQDAQAPRVFFGPFASGDQVMKSAEHRDEIAKKFGVMAFEMEGVGVWGQAPCIIVKGVCDYADSHKDKVWQPFAAATAASVARALVEYHTKSLLADEEDRPEQLAHRVDAVTSPGSRTLNTVNLNT
ncbi:hypothetical protein G7Z17_g6 [Cylindrodendrum hubeiense]|uniref:Nucleoside phosphorylase domain-containing protein n=1 Tax=Cylindrodendrum hubeiense TaxID=595255 RepID=A0A9P5LNG1_9HYPO|nr:hypothetical protein G7Z17_g6 [Cylindrodendrum hubeiense]